MAVQSPPVPMKQVASKNTSPLKIPLTPAKVMSPMQFRTTSPMTSAMPTTPETSTVPSMLNQPEPKKRKWLWILLGIFGVFLVLAIGIGLYLWLR